MTRLEMLYCTVQQISRITEKAIKKLIAPHKITRPITFKLNGTSAYPKSCRGNFLHQYVTQSPAGSEFFG